MKTNRLDNTRLSVLLPAELHARLAGYATRVGISLSEAARRALDAGLLALERAADPDLAEQREALEAMKRSREEMRARYGVYQGDLVNEVREERERQMDRVVWGHDDGQ